MMLFTFPQSNYLDGTYITANGTGERLNNYQIKTTKGIEKIGLKWSSGWSLYVPGKKEEHYTITPIVEGNMNFAYFEELCWIKNAAGGCRALLCRAIRRCSERKERSKHFEYL